MVTRSDLVYYDRFLAVSISTECDIARDADGLTAMTYRHNPSPLGPRCGRVFFSHVEEWTDCPFFVREWSHTFIFPLGKGGPNAGAIVTHILAYWKC